MKRGLELQILWIPIALVALAIGGVSFFFVRSLRAHLIEEIEAETCPALKSLGEEKK